MSDFTKGAHVVLSEKGKMQRVLPRFDAEGVVTSPHPSGDCVIVRWTYKTSPDRMHVSFLALSTSNQTEPK